MTSASPARSSRAGSVAQGARIAHHQARLVKGADQVLAARMVDAGLAADCRVHLRQQRGRHLHERDAALVAGRRKPGEIADHSAAEREQGAVAGEAVGDQHVDDARGAGERLVRFAVGENDFDDAAGTQAGAQYRQVQRRHGGVADDEHILRRQVLAEQVGAAEQPRIDEDRVAAGSEFDVQECPRSASRLGSSPPCVSGVYVRPQRRAALSAAGPPRRARAAPARLRCSPGARRSRRRYRRCCYIAARARP